MGTIWLRLPAMSGFIVKANMQGGGSDVQTMALRMGYDELVADLSDAFDLIPASVNLYSQHNATKLWVHMGSQGDLDVVLAEASEWGSHTISIEVSGVGAGRSLDAAGCLAGVGGTMAQVLYLRWLVVDSSAGFLAELEVWVIVVAAILANLGGFFYLLDDETSHNHPFRQWVRPVHKRALMLLLAPFSGDVLPLVSCGSCGLNAPIRSSTRDAIVKWGVLLLAVQDVAILAVLVQLHTGPAALEFAEAAQACLYATSFAILVNLPRRAAHFIVGSCETAFAEKEELADDARICELAPRTESHSCASPCPALPCPAPCPPCP